MLNEELSWTEVGALSTGSGSARDAFQLAFGDPTKELLPAGISLYKFNGFSTLGAGTITDATDLSPWWSPTYGFKHDAGLELLPGKTTENAELGPRILPSVFQYPFN